MSVKIIHTSASIFQFPSDPTEAACVTTNGMIKTDGNAITGKGIAKEANDFYHVSAKLGVFLKWYGNRCFDLGLYPAVDPICDKTDCHRMFHLISFPTKHDWRNQSDIGLIKTSCVNLLRICNARNIKKMLSSGSWMWMWWFGFLEAGFPSRIRNTG